MAVVGGGSEIVRFELLRIRSVALTWSWEVPAHLLGLGIGLFVIKEHRNLTRLCTTEESFKI